MKTATSLILVAAGAIIAFAITAHLGFLNLQVTGWVLILTGVIGAIITRSSSWLRRTPAAENRSRTRTASDTSQRPPPPRPAPGRQPAAAPDATQALHETIKEHADA
jgi:hypothetical protein